jgi:hypothetical protein
MSVHDYLCMVCYHDPSVHGVKARNLDPCVCCESPAALAAATDVPDVTFDHPITVAGQPAEQRHREEKP